MTNQILRRPEVERITGLGRSTIYDWMSKGMFPRPVKLGSRAVGWRERDIAAWLDTRQPNGEGGV
ncbi:MAG: AlpA family transcriptional regulator [Parvibaculum sp.]|nr:AlpA family transcriptional regulator [Parvibaculum sp.]